MPLGSQQGGGGVGVEWVVGGGKGGGVISASEVLHHIRADVLKVAFGIGLRVQTANDVHPI